MTKAERKIIEEARLDDPVDQPDFQQVLAFVKRIRPLVQRGLWYADWSKRLDSQLSRLYQLEPWSSGWIKVVVAFLNHLVSRNRVEGDVRIEAPTKGGRPGKKTDVEVWSLRLAFHYLRTGRYEGPVPDGCEKPAPLEIPWSPKELEELQTRLAEDEKAPGDPEPKQHDLATYVGRSEFAIPGDWPPHEVEGIDNLDPARIGPAAFQFLLGSAAKLPLVKVRRTLAWLNFVSGYLDKGWLATTLASAEPMHREDALLRLRQARQKIDETISELMKDRGNS